MERKENYLEKERVAFLRRFGQQDGPTERVLRCHGAFGDGPDGGHPFIAVVRPLGREDERTRRRPHVENESDVAQSPAGRLARLDGVAVAGVADKDLAFRIRILFCSIQWQSILIGRKLDGKLDGEMDGIDWRIDEIRRKSNEMGMKCEDK